LTPKEVVPSKYVLLELEIPKKLEKQIVNISDLKKGWDDLQVNDWTQQLGLKYFDGDKVLGIIVPSTIIPIEKNIVLNPLHKNYELIKVLEVKDYDLDVRLLS